eukprot:6375393-Alexandrium_andersonii.AAC.1
MSRELEKVFNSHGLYIDWEKNDATLRRKRGHKFTKGSTFLEEVLQHRVASSSSSERRGVSS